MRYDELKKTSKRNKELKLFEMFEQLNSDMREVEQRTLLELFQIYSGNDETHRKELERFFNSEETIYDSLEFNSNIKSLISKYIQPFFSKDDLVTFSPLNDKIEVIERVSKLVNDQIKSEDFVEELVKCVKDSCIYGKAFMSLGWSVEEITIPKKTRTIERDPNTGEIISESEVNDTETVTIEKPDFRAERVSDILYPKVSKWEDVPYVIKMERISPFIYNQRYNMQTKEIRFDRSTFDDYETGLDAALEKVPGSDASYSDAYENEILILHYFFANGDYYVGKIDKQRSQDDKDYYFGVKIIYEGSTPIPGVPIPIYFLNLEPITGRLAGESLINVGKNEHRKLMEADNHHLKMLRKISGDNLIISEMSGVDLKKLIDRKPGEPIVVEGDIRDGIVPFPNQGLTAEFLQARQIYKGTLDSTLGVNDFFQGNIGRAQALSEKIHTPEGFKLNGDLKVGDLVCTPDGKSAKVLELFPQGGLDLYKFKFSDGTETEACINHKWLVNSSKKNTSRVLETSQIMEELKNSRCDLAIPLGSVEYESKAVPINPYLLGLLLGDGSFDPKRSHVKLHTSSRDIVDYVESLGIKGYTYEPGDCNNGDFWSINISDTIGQIRDLGLLNTNAHTKFIPDQFKINSKDIRVEILRGLLDTDGHVCNPTKDASNVEFTSVSKQLAEDVAFLVRSLGGYAKITEGVSRSTKNGVTKDHGPKYRVNIRITGACGFNPFKIAEKASKWRPVKRNPQRRILSVEKSRVEKAQCMTIDHPDHLYLCGEGVIVTHNSARLTGVDSLLSNALSRLTVGMNQISKFILRVVDGLVLANRAFLPRTYVHIDTSLHVAEPIESYEIPYPLRAKISSPVDGGSDLSVKLGSFYQFLQLAMSMEQVKPGSFDIMGLLQYGFSMAGLPEVKRFIMKMPFTAEEATNLEMLDKAMRIMQQSALPNNENPFGSPIAPQGVGGASASQNSQQLDGTGQNMAQPGINEIGNF